MVQNGVQFTCYFLFQQGEDYGLFVALNNINA